VKMIPPFARRWILSIDPSPHEEKQTRDQRKMLNLNCLDGLSIGEISSMVKC
jgi:hypothetical protein